MRNVKFSELCVAIEANVVKFSGNVRKHISEILPKFQIVVDDCFEYDGDWSSSKISNVYNILNYISYSICVGDAFQYDKSMLSHIIESQYDDNAMKNLLKELYIDSDGVSWDIFGDCDDNLSDAVSEVNDVINQTDDVIPEFANASDKLPIDSEDSNDKGFEIYTSKRDDISLAFKEFPRFDITKVWMYGHDAAGRVVPIFVQLPEIPEVQRDVSVTTDISKMSDGDFMDLYPDHTIRTRKDEFYAPINGYAYDDLVGFIPKIDGFTDEQVLDNIIKYPQFNFMYRYIDGERTSFMNHIEIDGTLYPLKEAVHIVPDLENLPKKRIYYWDYIVRRYLLERDIKHVEHKYPLFGYFGEFMTLFTTPDTYAKYGYNDMIDMAYQCVSGRIKFYRSRNPLVRKVLDENYEILHM